MLGWFKKKFSKKKTQEAPIEEELEVQEGEVSGTADDPEQDVPLDAGTEEAPVEGISSLEAAATADPDDVLSEEAVPAAMLPEEEEEVVEQVDEPEQVATESSTGSGEDTDDPEVERDDAASVVPPSDCEADNLIQESETSEEAVETGVPDQVVKEEETSEVRQEISHEQSVDIVVDDGTEATPHSHATSETILQAHANDDSVDEIVSEHGKLITSHQEDNCEPSLEPSRDEEATDLVEDLDEGSDQDDITEICFDDLEQDDTPFDNEAVEAADQDIILGRQDEASSLISSTAETLQNEVAPDSVDLGDESGSEEVVSCTTPSDQYDLEGSSGFVQDETTLLSETSGDPAAVEEIAQLEKAPGPQTEISCQDVPADSTVEEWGELNSSEAELTLDSLPADIAVDVASDSSEEEALEISLDPHDELVESLFDDAEDLTFVESTQSQVVFSDDSQVETASEPDLSAEEEEDITNITLDDLLECEDEEDGETAAVSSEEEPPAPEKKVQVEQDKPKISSMFQRLQERLGKTRNNFIHRLDSLFRGKKEIDLELLDDLEEILITADLGVATAHDLLEAARTSVKRNELSDPRALKGVLRDRILEYLQESDQPAELVLPESGPFVIMVVGVNGVGKTTTIGKIAAKFVNADQSVLLVAGDTFRAAAIDQLKIWGDRVGVDVVAGNPGADPSSVVYDGVARGVAKDYDVVIIDTAGRLHTSVNLMEELKKIKRVIGKNLASAPHEVMLVLDATTGQNAISQAKFFHEAVTITGLTVTKLDGTAKGGIVANVCREIKIPVRFIGIGEQMDDLRDFDSQEFVEALFSRDDTTV